MIDNVEGELTVASHTHHISSSKENVRVDNIAMLKVKSTSSKQLIVDPKKVPGNGNDTNDDIADITCVINDKACAISPDSCDNNQQIKLQNEPDKLEDESVNKTRSSPSPITTYEASDEDMKIIATGCYEYVMDLLENWDSLPVEDDNQVYEEDKILYYLDPLAHDTSDLPVADSQNINNEDMECLAMACYEVVMDMVRNGDVYSEDEIANMYPDKPIHYLEVEPSVENNYEIPLCAYPSSSVSAYDANQNSHQEKKSGPKVLTHNSYNTVSQPTDSQPLLSKDDTASHCHMNVVSVDSLGQPNEQTGGNHCIEPNLEMVNNGKVATTLKYDGCASKNSLNEEPSSNDHLSKYACILLH